jgi:hypothetical protein
MRRCVIACLLVVVSHGGLYSQSLSWSALGDGVNGTVRAIAVDGDNIYVGGSFTQAGGVSAQNIATWNGNSWTALGGGVGGGVSAIAIWGGDVYVGGGFTFVNGTSYGDGGTIANGIAKWDGTRWSNVGGEYAVAGSVGALAATNHGLYVGGSFELVNNQTFNRIARWDGSSWHPLGSGVEGAVVYGYIRAIAVDGSNNVYVGGDFLTAGGKTVNGIARWNGGEWSPLGSGVAGGSRVVSSIAVSVNDVYIGGTFDQAGDVNARNVAR